MKSLVLLAFLVCHYLVIVSSSTTNKINLDGIKKHHTSSINKLITMGAKADPAWCPTCVSFISQSLDQLLNIIANVGVLGACSDLCNLLPNQVEATVCDLVCSIVGIEVFIDLVTGKCCC